MEQKKNRNYQVLSLVLICLSLFAVVEGNKNAPRNIIKVENGDVYECIDIYKQPSLLHPTLKEHKIKVIGLNKNENANNTRIGLRKSCPPGSVPIQTRMSKIISTKVASGYDPNTRFAGLVTKQTVPRLHPIFGSFAAYNIHKPKVGPTQRSSAILALESTVFGYLSRVEAGWMVNPGLFGDDNPRLYAGWIEENDTNTNGCYNTVCQGFIATSTSLPLGFAFPQISHPRERQYDVTIYIALREGRWELQMNGEIVGYWPSEVVPHLNPYTLKARWGGEVLKPDPSDTTAPEMGDGNFYRKWQFIFNAYVRQVVLQHYDDTWKIPRNDEVDVFWSNCYRASINEYRFDRDLGYSFIYGGKDQEFGRRC